MVPICSSHPNDTIQAQSLEKWLEKRHLHPVQQSCCIVGLPICTLLLLHPQARVFVTVNPTSTSHEPDAKLGQNLSSTYRELSPLQPEFVSHGRLRVEQIAYC